jgi:NADH-quinone oxidoreductase subunit J
VLLVVQLAWALMEANGIGGPVSGESGAESVSSVRQLGRVLFTDYVFAFEATSILILVAMVGAVMLARREGERS